MKKIGLLLSASLLFLLVLAGCGNTEPDYDYTTKQFEAALNKGEDLEGKTVSVDVSKIVPNSAFGYNIQAGEHLNFVSADNPNVKEGEKVILKVEEVKSMMGSFVITYEK
ncbi:hypothetical protein ABEX78_22455 [Priestia megaterium]